jgi:hypothetical protein
MLTKQMAKFALGLANTGYALERASGPRQGLQRRRRAAGGVRGGDGGLEHAVDVMPAGCRRRVCRL